MELYLTSHVPFYCLLRGSFDFTRIFNLQQLSYVRVEYCITLVLLWKRFTACCFMLHSVCLFACLSVCLSAYLSVCLSVCPPICLSVCLPACLPVRLSVCLSACLSVRLSVCLSACLSAYMSVCLPVCLSAYLSVCPPICLSVRLSVCLSAYLSVCLSVCLSVFLSVCLPLSVHRPISTPALSQPLQSLYHLQSGTKTHSVPELQHLNKHRTVELHRVLIVSCLCGCAVLHSKAQPECSRLLTANGEYRGQTVCGVDWCCGVRETWV